MGTQNLLCQHVSQLAPATEHLVTVVFSKWKPQLSGLIVVLGCALQPTVIQELTVKPTETAKPHPVTHPHSGTTGDTPGGWEAALSDLCTPRNYLWCPWGLWVHAQLPAVIWEPSLRLEGTGCLFLVSYSHLGTLSEAVKNSITYPHSRTITEVHRDHKSGLRDPQPLAMLIEACCWTCCQDTQ